MLWKPFIDFIIGTDFEITFRPKEDMNRTSTTTVINPALHASRDSVGSGSVTSVTAPVTRTSWLGFRSSSTSSVPVPAPNAAADTMSINSDNPLALTSVPTMTLRASDAQTRLLWVTMLQRALAATLDNQK